MGGILLWIMMVEFHTKGIYYDGEIEKSVQILFKKRPILLYLYWGLHNNPESKLKLKLGSG